MSGAFAKIAAASATGGGNNIRDGIYKFLVEKISLQNGHTGECFIAEFRVVESTANGALDEQGRPVVPNAVGSTCSMVCNLTKHESAAGNAKAFVVKALAGLNLTEQDITPEVMAWVCGEKNPLRGLAVRDETYRGVNKGKSNPANRGLPLTLNKWHPIAQTEAEVKTASAWLDANPPRVDVGAQQPAAQAMKPAMEAAAQTTAAAPKPALGGLLGGVLGNK